LYSAEKPEEIKIGDIIGKKTLIIGDLRRGKTQLTAALLEQLLKIVPPQEVTVIDMAPAGKEEVGGMLCKYTQAVFRTRYLQPPSIRAPRIEGENRDEVLSLADYNRRAIEPLIMCFLDHPTQCLIVNDLSIYLQSGNLEDILRCMDISSTFISNAYYGTSLSDDKGSSISLREKKLVEELISKSEIVIRL